MHYISVGNIQNREIVILVQNFSISIIQAFKFIHISGNSENKVALIMINTKGVAYTVNMYIYLRRNLH